MQNGKRPLNSDGTTSAPARPTSDTAWSQIQAALRGLRFGQVTISIQDGVIVQIERIERTRY